MTETRRMRNAFFRVSGMPENTPTWLSCINTITYSISLLGRSFSEELPDRLVPPPGSRDGRTQK